MSWLHVHTRVKYDIVLVGDCIALSISYPLETLYHDICVASKQDLERSTMEHHTLGEIRDLDCPRIVQVKVRIRRVQIHRKYIDIANHSPF
jgi:hypothetical protein